MSHRLPDRLSDPAPRGVGRIGYAPGVYDLFHVGHLNILRQARGRCDHLVAGVVSDEMAELAKGRRPVVPLAERLEIVRSVRFVDSAFVETVPDKLATWRQVRFDVLFKGDDWRGTEKGRRLERDFASVGVEIVYFPYTAHTSSTQLRKALDALAEHAVTEQVVTGRTVAEGTAAGGTVSSSPAQARRVP